MGFYCTTMLAIAMELALHNRAYEDIASKFFEHFVQIADALNNLGGAGLWHEEDGFYYDLLKLDGRSVPLRLRSLVGIIPLLAVHILEEEVIHWNLRPFERRMTWFLHNRKDMLKYISSLEERGEAPRRRRLLALPSRQRLERALRYLLNENEFLSPFGVRSLSRVYKDRPFEFHCDGHRYTVTYVPGDSDSSLFGGNSNWRGPIWFPINYLLIEALEQYHNYYGDSFTVECPTGSGRRTTLGGVARELAERLGRLFFARAGRRPCHGDECRWVDERLWRDYIPFHEYFDGDTGRGLGASHQTGWTALIAALLEDCAKWRADYSCHLPLADKG
jgi:hypothetical protein